MYEIQIRTPILFGLLAILGFVALYHTRVRESAALRDFFFLFFVLMTVGFLATFAFWTWRETNRRVRESRLLEIEASIASDVTLARIRAVRGLSDEQLDFLRHEPIPADLEVLSGKPGAVFRLVTRSGRVLDLSFVAEFVLGSTRVHLRPIGAYSEGSNDYKDAVALTHHLIETGYAVRVGGPYPARWKNGVGATIAGFGLDRIYGFGVENVPEEAEVEIEVGETAAEPS